MEHIMRSMALAAVMLMLGCPGGRGMDRTSDWIVENAQPLSRGSLVVANRKVTDAELKQLLDDPRVPALTELTVHGNQLGPAAAALLTTHPKTQRLEVLQIHGNQLGDRGLAALAGWPGTKTIRTLYAANNGAGALAAAAFARSPYLEAMTLLELGRQPLGDGAVADLVQIRVQQLRLDDAGLHGAAAAQLLSGAAADELFLGENPIGGSGLPGLTAIAPAVVHLPKCGLTGADVRALAAVPAPRLRTLVLKYQPLGDEGLDALAGAPWLAHLQFLDVMGAGATPAARARLRAAWGSRPGLTLEQ